MPQPGGVLGQEHVQQQRVGGDLVALDLEVMLGQHQGGPAGLVGALGLLLELAQHGPVPPAIQAKQAGAQIRSGRHGHRVEEREFHQDRLPFHRRGKPPCSC